jgi:formylglycine-generating enzyme required for sulfatase activity
MKTHSPATASLLKTPSLALAAVLLCCASACEKEDIAPDPVDPAGDPVTMGCPTNLPGPTMVALPTPSGGRYCMDSTEVTQGQYLEFVSKILGTTDPAQYGRAIPPGTISIPDQCKNNVRLVPSDLTNISCVGRLDVMDKANGHPDYPVGCVDWCDAHAYCAWAGKRLCGAFGGGTVPAEKSTDPELSEWMWACTQGGRTAYPYGDEYEAGRCLDLTYMGESGISFATARPSDVPECRGTLDPFDQVYNLSLNRAEWQNACSLTHTSHIVCALHSSVAVNSRDEATSARCDSKVDYGGVLSASPQAGIRCCSD